MGLRASFFGHTAVLGIASAYEERGYAARIHMVYRIIQAV
jgi:hypothetical protein